MSLRQDVGEICTQIREGKNSMINKFKNSLSRLDHSPRRGNESISEDAQNLSEPSTCRDPGPHSMKCWMASIRLPGSRVQKDCNAHNFQREDAIVLQRWAGDFHGTVIDFGFWGSIPSPAASPLTFGWSSDMAKLVTEHKTEVLNKEQGQMKVTMRQMTSNKPSDVSSVSSWQEFETSCLLLREDG